MSPFNIFVAVLIALGLCLGMPRKAEAFEAERAAFSISFDGFTSNLSIISTTIMPGKTLDVFTRANALADAGVIKRSDKGWTWHAPDQPGLNVLTFTQGADQIIVNVFVLTPWRNGKQDNLNGYRIGKYSASPLRGLSTYAAPDGFIEVTPALLKTRISPHFTLEQFLCKQQPGHTPAYVLVKAATLIKLERLLEATNKHGWKSETFTVMSGFRTPFYNQSIGNKTTSSRHLYGGAADIFIDADGDGRMDDLNGDGRINKKDAEALAALAEAVSRSDTANWPHGGLAVYPENSAHGPFVHIDARGYQARWGF